MNEETQSTELVVSPGRDDYAFSITKPNEMSVGNIIALAKLAAKGGMSDPKGAEGLAIRAVFGLQMGFTPVEGMQGLYLIEGKPVVGGQLLAKRIRQSGVYDYAVIEHDNTKCKIEGFSIKDGSRVSLGFGSFTMDQARAAGLAEKAIWKKYPENMLFARAIANLYRFHMPDLIGMPFYTDGEEVVHEDAAPVVDTATQAMQEAATKVNNRATKRKAEPKQEPSKDDNVIEAEFVTEEPQSPPAGEVQSAATTAPEPVAPATPTADGSTTTEAEQPYSEGKKDPFDEQPIWEGENIVLLPWSHPDKPGEEWCKLYCKHADVDIRLYATLKSKDVMIEAAKKADSFWGAPISTVAAETKSTDLPTQKIATAILNARKEVEGVPEEQPAPAAPAATADAGLAETLKQEIGEAQFNNIKTQCENKGVDFDWFLAEFVPQVRSDERYSTMEPDERASRFGMKMFEAVRIAKEKAQK